MAPKSILVMATLDTKREAVEAVCAHIRERGHRPLIMDLSTRNESPLRPDITAVEVALAGGGTEADTRGETLERAKRRDIMVRGASKITKKLLEDGKIDALIGVGGVSNGKMVSDVCQTLPFGLPKLILASGAGMGSYNYIGRSDIALVESVGDSDSMNLFLKNSITRAAGMICGAAESGARLASLEIEELRRQRKKVIALTHLSVDECVEHIMDILRRKGNYEVLSFQSTGIGDMVMEDLIEGGTNFDAVLDLCIAGLSEYLIGGNRAAAPTRLDAAGKRGIPQVITPTALDYISCGPLGRRDKIDPLWEKRKLKDRKLWIMDEFRVLAKISAEEAVEIGKAVAAKLNRAKGPVKFLVPMQGWNIPNRAGGALFQPEIDRVLIDTLKQEADRTVVDVREFDLYMNSYGFAEVIVQTLEELLGTARSDG